MRCRQNNCVFTASKHSFAHQHFLLRTERQSRKTDVVLFVYLDFAESYYGSIFAFIVQSFLSADYVIQSSKGYRDLSHVEHSASALLMLFLATNMPPVVLARIAHFFIHLAGLMNVKSYFFRLHAHVRSVIRKHKHARLKK